MGRKGILEFMKNYLRDKKDSKDTESVQVCLLIKKLFGDLRIHYDFLSIEEDKNYSDIIDLLYMKEGKITNRALAKNYYMEFSMCKRLIKKCNDNVLKYIQRKSQYALLENIFTLQA